MPELLDELNIARSNGSLKKLMKTYKKVERLYPKYRSEIYICRGSERGKRLDRRAVGIISIALGHSREDTAITNYIRNL